MNALPEHPFIERHGRGRRDADTAPRLTSVIVCLAWAVIRQPNDKAIARTLARCILTLSGDEDPDRRS